MDDKIEGKWDQGKGKVKEEAGKLGGDKSTEIGGKVDQGKGKLKEGLGNVKDALHEDEPVDR
ncbi:MAG: CsbD family protein [Chloroflexi bacterium]|nr:MAG: CsbD family protein [Chloroflexota bacterium]